MNYLLLIVFLALTACYDLVRCGIAEERKVSTMLIQCKDANFQCKLRLYDLTQIEYVDRELALKKMAECEQEYASCQERVEDEKNKLRQNLATEWTKEQCREIFRSIETIKDFQFYAHKLINGEIRMDTAVLNRCMHSVDGMGDLKVLEEITQQVSETHSVCQTDFADQLLAFDQRMQDNIAHNKVLFFTKKQKHRLSRFFSLLAGQVVFTCKKSIAEKLEEAERDNGKLVDSINMILESVNKSDNERTSESAEMKRKISNSIDFVFNLATKSSVTLFNRVENIILLESMKPSPDATFSIGVTVNSDQMEKMDAFMKTKVACELIDVYAKNSLYTIPRLAWKGYMARDEWNKIDSSLNLDWRVQRWIKAIQYCQGVQLVKLNLDLDQEEKVRLSSDGMITIDVNRDESAAGTSVRAAHIYQQEDTFSEFDSDLRCYTYSEGLKGWLLKRVGQLLISKYITFKVNDESFKQSMFKDYQETDNEVQFAGTSAALTSTGTAATHAATGAAAVAHHSYLGGTPGAEIGVVFAISVAITAVVVFLSTVVAFWCRPDYD